MARPKMEAQALNAPPWLWFHAESNLVPACADLFAPGLVSGSRPRGAEPVPETQLGVVRLCRRGGRGGRGQGEPLDTRHP